MLKKIRYLFFYLSIFNCLGLYAMQAGGRDVVMALIRQVLPEREAAHYIQDHFPEGIGNAAQGVLSQNGDAERLATIFPQLEPFLPVMQNVLGQNDNSPENNERVARTQAAANKAKKIAEGVPALLKRWRDNKAAREKQRIQETVAQFKEQNTVLNNWGEYLAFYKGDIVRLGCFSLDFLAELFTYRKIFEQKVDYVLETVLEDAENLEAMLKKAELAVEANNKRNRVVKFIVNRFKTLPEVMELKKYITTKHKMIGYNPFKSSLLPYLGLNLVKTKALKFIESLFLTQMNLKHLMNEEVLDAFVGAYKKDENGDLVSFQDIPPFSVATLLMMLLNSRYLIERIDFSANRQLRMMNKLLGLNIPNIFFSSFVHGIAVVGSLGLAVKLTDTILNNSWSFYALKNQSKFLKLIQRYNEATKSTGNDLEQVEKELRKFISYGHAQGIFSWLWVQSKVLANGRIGLLFSTPVCALLGWKIYSSYRAYVA